MKTNNPINFHLSLPCRNIEKTVEFYTQVLGLNYGRRSEKWIDIDFFGNQLTFVESSEFDFNFNHYKLQGHDIATFHFGVILEEKDWRNYHKQFTSNGLEVTEIKTFFSNHYGEQMMYTIKAPDNYELEFKCFKIRKQIFWKNQ